MTEVVGTKESSAHCSLLSQPTAGHKTAVAAPDVAQNLGFKSDGGGPRNNSDGSEEIIRKSVTLCESHCLYITMSC